MARSPDSHRLIHAAIPLAIAVSTTVVLHACAPRSSGGEFRGQVPLRTLDVSGVTLPEVAANGTSTPFVTRAEPGGLLLVFFGFVSCPDICPTTLSDVKRALASLGPAAGRVSVAFITVDPVRDSASVLRPWLQSFFPARAHALRPASQAELGAAQQAFQATSTTTRQADGHIDVSHTATTSVVDEAGIVRLTWSFGTNSADMAADLRRLLAAEPGPGTAARSAAPSPAPAAASGGAVSVDSLWLRASPVGVTVGAGYLRLSSPVSDRLLEARVPDSVAAAVEMHEVVTEAEGSLRMRRVDSISLPAGQPVEFRPGGRHLMLTGLRAPLRPGDRVMLTLRFEQAGERTLTALVRGS